MKLNKELILASASPRRKELLQDLDCPFTVEASSCEEILDSSCSLERAIEQIAYAKAYDVFQNHPDAIVIGCDTIVTIDKEVLGKPKNKDDARRMLLKLRDKQHEVISAAAIISQKHVELFHEITQVTFHDFDDALLEEYLNSDEPYDKAGSYGIQGRGKLFVKGIIGDYYNVMGLPIAKIYRVLKSVEW